MLSEIQDIEEVREAFGGSKRRDEYDSFSQSTANPHASCQKQQIALNVDEQVLEYFNKEAAQTDIPYQEIINMYLRQCVAQHWHLSMD